MELLEAVKTGNKESVQEHIRSGADMNQADKHGWRALNWAAAKGKLEVVQLLLQHGADVHATGIDQRTPAMIALAAGHADVASFLRQVESQVGGKPSQPQRKYCRAYHLADLRRFAGWSENPITADTKNAEHGSGNDQPAAHPPTLGDASIVYLHEDFAVTADVWRNENVVFDQGTAAWKEFCATVLNFKVPDDLDLIVPPAAGSTPAVIQ